MDVHNSIKGEEEDRITYSKMYMFVDMMIIRIVHFYVDTRGETLKKHFLLMTCLMETSISGIGIDFTLNANFDNRL